MPPKREDVKRVHPLGENVARVDPQQVGWAPKKRHRPLFPVPARKQVVALPPPLNPPPPPLKPPLLNPLQVPTLENNLLPNIPKSDGFFPANIAVIRRTFVNFAEKSDGYGCRFATPV